MKSKEAFESIIFQKRDNGYISDAYRNDIGIVLEDLDRLETQDKIISECIELLEISGQNTKQIVLEKLRGLKND